MADSVDPRILFAAERTLLAWIRTGIAMMGFGFVVARLGMFLREMADVRHLDPGRGGLSLWAGTVLVILGAALNLLGAVEYAQISRRLRAGDPSLPERPIQFALGVAVLLALIGLVGAIYLVSTAS